MPQAAAAATAAARKRSLSGSLPLGVAAMRVEKATSELRAELDESNARCEVFSEALHDADADIERLRADNELLRSELRTSRITAALVAVERDVGQFGSERLRAELRELECELHEQASSLRAAVRIAVWRRTSAASELRRAVQRWAAFASSSLKRTLRPDTGRWTRARARARSRHAMRRAMSALSQQRARRLAQRAAASSTLDRRTRRAWEVWCALGSCRVLPLAGRLRRFTAARLQMLAIRGSWTRWAQRHDALVARAATERGVRLLLVLGAMRRWRQVGCTHGRRTPAGAWWEVWVRRLLLQLPPAEWDALRVWLQCAKGADRGTRTFFRHWAEQTALERQQLIERRPQELQAELFGLKKLFARTRADLAATHEKLARDGQNRELSRLRLELAAARAHICDLLVRCPPCAGGAAQTLATERRLVQRLARHLTTPLPSPAAG